MSRKPTAKNNVRVVSRIRPLSKIETAKGCKETLRSFSEFGLTKNEEEKVNQKYIYDPNKEPELIQCQEQISHGASKPRWFELDAVFDVNSTQEEVYIRSGAKHSVCEDMFHGFNSTILAYGQTGSGKTFSMGTAVDGGGGDGGSASVIREGHGLIPRACYDLFQTIDRKCDGNARVELSYLEIYNEELRDLLVEKDNIEHQRSLKIRETLDGEVYVSGIEKRIVKSPYEIGILMEQGANRRVVASTAMNAVSSRSHAMCVLKVEGVIDKDDNDGHGNQLGPDKFCSKLTLVDLAGSERIKKTGALGSRAKEGININKSLLALGQVVSALAYAGGKRSKRRIPPYRDSKLTRLLQDSLGGNSQTIMIACVSPADFNTEESINTLRYATNARNIKNTATRNIVQNISPEEAQKLLRENQLLKQQVTELRSSLQMMMVSSRDDSFSITSCDTGTTPSITNGAHDDDDNMSIQSLTINMDSDFISSSNEDQQKLLAKQEKITQDQSKKIAELEKDITKFKHKVKKAKTNLRRTSVATAIELPALKMQFQELQEELMKKKNIENENAKLRMELQDLKNEAQSAQYAATKLSDIMDQVHNMSVAGRDRRKASITDVKKKMFNKMLGDSGGSSSSLKTDSDLTTLGDNSSRAINSATYDVSNDDIDTSKNNRDDNGINKPVFMDGVVGGTVVCCGLLVVIISYFIPS